MLSQEEEAASLREMLVQADAATAEADAVRLAEAARWQHSIAAAEGRADELVK